MGVGSTGWCNVVLERCERYQSSDHQAGKTAEHCDREGPGIKLW